MDRATRLSTNLPSERARRLAERLFELFQNHEVWAAIDDALREEREETKAELARHTAVVCVHDALRGVEPLGLCEICKETLRGDLARGEKSLEDEGWGV